MSWKGQERAATDPGPPATDVEGAVAAMAQQIVRLPLLFWVYTGQMLATTFEGMSRISAEAAGAVAQRVEAPATGRPARTVPVQTDAPQRSTANPKERRTMSDTNLNDKMVKLVEFTIVSIQRGKEKILEGPKQVLETDDLTGEAFSNARIADWVTEHSEAAKDLDLDDLRVFYNVLSRWPKRDLKFDERTLAYDERKTELLDEIARGIRHLGETA